jgi:hypothetical protein
MMDISAPVEFNGLKIITEGSSDLQIPSLIAERASSISDLTREQFRYIDNEELTLISILDEDGQLVLSARLVEFMIFMTRLTKVIIALPPAIYFLHKLSSVGPSNTLCSCPYDPHLQSLLYRICGKWWIAYFEEVD